MALIISIETSTKVCSVALQYEAQLIATHTLHVERSHAEALLCSVEHLLDISFYKKKDLAAVAVSSGPGSYTGLRIGVSTAKGLCYALGIPLIAVNTLEALVHGMRPYNTAQALLCPMLDARRREVYCLLADDQGHLLTPAHPRVMDQYSFQAWLQDYPILFFGDGAEKCKPLLAHHSRAFFIDHIYPEAQHIGTLAYAQFQQAAFEDLTYFSPLYLKPFQGKRIGEA
ncbi:MAG: tRNA (adenosine(37)-N6)-threonylcarbamoyltransferase complex dimerization subunit type 1 TsaB [Amoebophilaceae bacterium]|nr:tRNA (adenosine(37)-N6)-threonylcarbamoyltransferase complex dimerization subunit type 1 TsaB [Amoebophilaceae bacterium]